MKETSGDVFKVYVTPPSSSFPWIQVFKHEYGIKKKGQLVGGINASKGIDREVIALRIGEEIIRNSKVLQDWFEDK